MQFSHFNEVFLHFKHIFEDIASQLVGFSAIFGAFGGLLGFYDPASFKHSSKKALW